MRRSAADGLDGHYDFAFIDADKSGYDIYYEHCLALIRPGGLILIDNTFHMGQIAERERWSENTPVVDALNRKIHGRRTGDDRHAAGGRRPHNLPQARVSGRAGLGLTPSLSCRTAVADMVTARRANRKVVVRLESADAIYPNRFVEDSQQLYELSINEVWFCLNVGWPCRNNVTAFEPAVDGLGVALDERAKLTGVSCILTY